MSRFPNGELIPDPSVVLCEKASELMFERTVVPLLVETPEIKELDELAGRALLSCQRCDGSRIRAGGTALCALADSTLAASLRSAKGLTQTDTWEA